MTRQRPPRETESLPSNIKPALGLVLFLATVVGVIALAAVGVDRFIYG